MASLITFLIIGIWHGASWKYVAFGFWNGMVILVSTLLQPVSDKVVAALHIERKSAWYQMFSMLRTFVIVLIGYYFDIADGFRAAMGMMVKSVTDLHLSQLRPGAVLEALLDKYADAGLKSFESLDILKVDPLSAFGTPMEIINLFGGKANYLKALHQLEAELYLEEV